MFSETRTRPRQFSELQKIKVLKNGLNAAIQITIFALMDSIVGDKFAEFQNSA